MNKPLLEGKRALIFGLANKHSISWGIAKALHEHGAEIALSYAIPKLERRVLPLAAEVGATFVRQCDVSSDDELDAIFDEYEEIHGTVDVVVHAIAFAPHADLQNDYSETSRSGFAQTMDISAYSLVAIAKRSKKLMPDGGSILTLTYYGAEKAVPGYNVMGVAKAALEASVRYLAAELGQHGIRVNAISAGPIKTLAAAGVKGFRKMLSYVGPRAPLRRNVTQEDVGSNAVWLASNLSSGVTGEIVYVDAGYNILGMFEPADAI